MTLTPCLETYPPVREVPSADHSQLYTYVVPFVKNAPAARSKERHKVVLCLVRQISLITTVKTFQNADAIAQPLVSVCGLMEQDSLAILHCYRFRTR